MSNQTISSERRDDGSIVIISGDRLTIEHAADFTMCFREALASSPSIAVEFTANVEMDVTALQILCSACKTAEQEGKVLTYQGAGIASLHQTVASAGAERHSSCREANNHQCIWFGGTNNG